MTRFLPQDFEIHSGRLKSGAWLLAASEHEAAGRPKFQEVPSKGLDTLGITQRKLNGNFNSWMDELSDQDKHEGSLWYPTGNDWGHHMADEHGRHPDKVFGVMSKMSPQRDWYGNLDDAHMMAQNHGRNPSGISKPAGISGTDNLRQSMRVMDAEDHPDAINAAFLGTKNVGGRAVPRQPRDLPKTHDFYTALRDPEAGGAGNYAHQPAVADSWMSRSMLWSKKAWDEAQAGGKPLSWPGQGTGEGLDKHLPVKKPNPETGKWEVTGSKPPTARDVAARITGMGGGYDRMRQAMQQGAARHDMPFAHGAQAAVWKSISKNKNPNDPEFDHSKVGPPGTLWNQMWNQRASGLHVPQQQGLIARVAAHGSIFDPHGPEDSLDEGWGTAEDIAAILRHVAAAPGWDHWEGRPKLISLGPTSQSSPLESHEQQRMGPHPGEIEASAWYTAGSGKAPWNNRSSPQHRPVNKPTINRFPADLQQGEEPEEDAQSEFDLTASRWYLPEPKLSWYVTADDGLDESDDELKKKKQPDAEPAGLNTGGETAGGAVPTYRIPSGGGGAGMGGGSMPSAGGGGTSMPSPPSATGPVGHPDGGPPSQNLTQALQRAGIDPSMYPTISGFSATEGSNPSGAPTLGFTDSQAGSSLDQHALALSKQIKDRASVTGEFPHAGTPEQQASWMATLVGQNGSSSDWQGNAQPARSDYVNRIVKSMPGSVPATGM